MKKSNKPFHRDESFRVTTQFADNYKDIIADHS